MTKLVSKDDYMQTSTGKVANFQLPEVEVTAKSPTGDDWKDRNLYQAYKGRRYISEGRQKAEPLAFGLAGLTALPGITALAPAVSTTLNNPYVNAVLTADGVRNALSGEGVQKTYRLAKEGNYWGATKSGVVDALDLYGGYGLLKTGTNAFKNRYLFQQTPNSFTRGIGSEKGLEDLRVSGKIRGSRGTEVSAKEFGKEMRRHKDEWNALEQEFPGIKQKWFRRELSEPEFNAINTKFTQLENNKAVVAETKPRIQLKKKYLFSSEDFDNPGYGSFENRGTKTYQDYLRDSKNEGVGVTHDQYWKDDPMAYFYNDGRNPITSGHTYANSNYGVKIDNVDQYNPYIHTAHQHYTTQGPVKLQDPNVTVYGKGPFNSTIRLDKNTFKPLYIEDLKRLIPKNKKYSNLYYSYPITNNPMRYVKDGKYDTSQIVSDFKKGIEEARGFLNSDTYKQTALRNIREAENMGLHYTPTTSSDGFKSLMDDGVKLEIDTKINAGGATSMFGGSIGTPTPIIVNPKSKLNYTALHEGLHVGEFGKAPKKMIGESDQQFLQRAKKDSQFLKHKVNEVFKNTDAGIYDFSSQTGEAATNMLDVGKRLNVKWGQEYPGDEQLISMLKSFEKSGDTKSGIVPLLRLNTPEGRQAVWRALNGTQFITIPAIAGVSLIPKNNNTQLGN